MPAQSLRPKWVLRLEKFLMAPFQVSTAPSATTVSPLMLADRLLSLAQEAERSGLHRPAQRLLRLAYAVCNEKPAFV
jgi:hypothetical protein